MFAADKLSVVKPLTVIHHMKENLGGCNVKFTDVELKEFRDAIEKIEFREPETVLTDR